MRTIRPWATGIALCASIMLTASPVAFAATQAPSQSTSSAVTTHSVTWTLNGGKSLSFPVIEVQGKTFISASEIGQFLQSNGLVLTVTSSRAQLSNLPSVYSDAQTTVNGDTVPGGATLMNGNQAYINLSGLARTVGATLNFNAAQNQLSLGWSSNSVTSAARKASTSTGLAVQPSLHLSTTVVSKTASLNKTRSSTKTGTSAAKVKSTQTKATQKQPTLPVKSLPFVVNGQSWRNIPAVNSGQQWYLDMGTLEELFTSYGIQINTVGKQTVVSWVPHVYSKSSLQALGTSAPTTLIQAGGDWFVPTKLLTAIGAQATVAATGNHNAQVDASFLKTPLTVTGKVVDAQGNPVPDASVAAQDALGHVSVVHADTTGNYTVKLATATGNIIGVSPKADDWYGETAIVNATNQTGITLTTTQTMTSVTGHLNFTGEPYKVTEISIRNILTHAHYYLSVDENGNFKGTVPVGPYEAFALLTSAEPVYLVQTFLATPGENQVEVYARALPAKNTLGTAHATVVAGDSKVSKYDMVTAANIFEHVFQMDVDGLGIHPTKPLTITLYSTPTAYQKHFQSEGFSASDAKNVAQNSVAVSEGPQSISVDMQAFGQTDGPNILAHELTHSLIAYVSQNIPDWANEGIAWHDGVLGELSGSPSVLMQAGIQWYEWSDIVAHQAKGDILDLLKAGSLDGNYNVEAQDYFAVQNELLNPFGMQKFMDYVNNIDKNGATAFPNAFGESESTFSTKVTSDLVAYTKQTDNGFTFTVRVLPGGPSSLYVGNPAGSYYKVSGLSEGNSYTITCHKDGTVQVPQGLIVSSMAPLPSMTNTDWVVGVYGTNPKADMNRQEFDIADDYGVPYDVSILLYNGQGEVEHAYPAIAFPGGLQLTDLQSIPSSQPVSSK